MIRSYIVDRQGGPFSSPEDIIEYMEDMTFVSDHKKYTMAHLAYKVALEMLPDGQYVFDDQKLFDIINIIIEQEDELLQDDSPTTKNNVESRLNNFNYFEKQVLYN